MFVQLPQLPRHFVVVANDRSGAARAAGADALRGLVRERLGPSLVDLTLVPPERIDAALEAAFMARPDGVAVIGGDGTIRVAAALARRSGVPAAFLPGGTLNVVPKRIWSARSLAEILEELGAGRTRILRLGAGEANGELFLVAATFGAAPEVSRLRELFRHVAGASDAARFAAEVWRVLPRLMRPSVRILTPPVDLGRLPAFAAMPGGADQVLQPTDADAAAAIGQFECVAVTAKGVLGLAVAAWRATRRPDWRDDPRVVTFNAAAVDVAGERRRLHLAVDGERMRLDGPVKLRFIADAVPTIAPAIEEAEPGGSRDG